MFAPILGVLLTMYADRSDDFCIQILKHAKFLQNKRETKIVVLHKVIKNVFLYWLNLRGKASGQTNFYS